MWGAIGMAMISSATPAAAAGAMFCGAPHFDMLPQRSAGVGNHLFSAISPTCRHRPLRQPRRPAARDFALVVIARRLLDGAMPRLLHGLGERHARARGFGEIAGT